MRALIDKISETNKASKEELLLILGNKNEEIDGYLYKKADETRRRVYGGEVYLRGLIEFTNHCKNDCFYCGIRASNKGCQRFRLNKEQILSCCDEGNSLGFSTFVLQGGEDFFYTDDFYCDLIREIKKRYPRCAVTLSIGERKAESYQRFFEAGADRYLLRHETAGKEHYEKLHPASMSFENRIACLLKLREIGFQTGAGMMIGSPYQTLENIAGDLMFLQNFRPHMVGIGPFIPHHETPFKDFKVGTLRDTLVALALTRLMLPEVLLPATTALGSLCKDGRVKGLKAGANVVMPNLSPTENRKQYDLYDNKLSTGSESAEGLELLKSEIKSAGYEPVMSRGDSLVK